MSDIDLVSRQVLLQVRDRDLGTVKDTRGQCAVDIRLHKDVQEMLFRAGTAGRN
jgi:hypothetical protein